MLPLALALCEILKALQGCRGRGLLQANVQQSSSPLLSGCSTAPAAAPKAAGLFRHNTTKSARSLQTLPQPTHLGSSMSRTGVARASAKSQHLCSSFAAGLVRQHAPLLVHTCLMVRQHAWCMRRTTAASFGHAASAVLRPAGGHVLRPGLLHRPGDERLHRTHGVSAPQRH